MNNPWKEIRLQDYENHMRLDSVGQLQAMNAMMREQFAAYPAETVMILGIAGGNGLDHAEGMGFSAVYGVDINPRYLQACRERYPQLQGVLETVCADLLTEPLQLPRSDLLIANLLVEYIGYPRFQKAVEAVSPRYVSCGIQINEDDSFVSDSPYLHVFDRLDEVHHQMEETALTKAMLQIGYQACLRKEMPLPNGKKLVRLDFVLNGTDS